MGMVSVMALVGSSRSHGWSRRHEQSSGTAATLLFELSLVVASPELCRRPGLVMPGADGFQALHLAEDIQTPGDVPGGQADILQFHSFQRRQVGHRGGSA